MPRIPPELASSRHHNNEAPLTHLSQAANIAEIDELGCGEWTILYGYQHGDEGSLCYYSGLISPARVIGALKQTGWGISIGDGAPGFTQRYIDSEEVTTYDRFGSSGIEPILYSRNFHRIKPRQFDLSEEFRLFLNLYHDRHNDRYIYIDERGNEILAAEILPGRTRVLTHLLRRYMAARQLALVLLFDHRAYADVDLDIASTAALSKQISAPDRQYSFNVAKPMDRILSRLFGKKIIMPPTIMECRAWPYDEGKDRKHSDFIVGVTDGGLPLTHNCNPDFLSNYFGANERAPHYLTPVWFTRSVLSKYYNDPNKYSVEDGYLRCGSLWGMQIDNNLPDHVVVYLCDLGRDLHYEEQIYWSHFNVKPQGRSTSKTNFKRSFLAQFTDPTAPDLVFKQLYTQLNEAWASKFKWPIFRPLHEADSHILKQLRVPISDGLSEFETQVLFLVKLLVDSLNDIGIAKAGGGALADEKSIAKLKRYLEVQQYPYVDRDIELLRTLQELRSVGAAHTKGRRFDKTSTSVGLDRNSPRDVFRDLLVRANQMLSDLPPHFIPPKE